VMLLLAAAWLELGLDTGKIEEGFEKV